jgi:glycosyltransferase involved in cell wall biosynthesis
VNILYLTFNKVNVGTYYRAYGFGKHLAERGHQVTLVTTSNHSHFFLKQKDYSRNFREIQTPDLFSGSLRSGWDPWNTLVRLLYLRNKKYDIVHTFEARPTVIYPALTMKNAGSRLIMDWSDWFGKGGSVEERPNQIIRTILRPVETYFEESFRILADGSTVICNTLKQKLLDLGVKNSNIIKLYNGVDINSSIPIRKDSARIQLNLPLKIPIIGWLGVSFYRDAVFMAKSFDKLTNLLPDFKIFIIGYFNYDFKKMVTKPEYVLQTGYISEELLNLYMSAVDLFWLPLVNSNANKGRFPMKLTKYMTFSKPIIATKVGDIPLIFKEKPIGILVDDKPEEFALYTVNLIKDKIALTSFGRNAKIAVEENFLWRDLTTKLENFYSIILNKD